MTNSCALRPHDVTAGGSPPVEPTVHAQQPAHAHESGQGVDAAHGPAAKAKPATSNGIDLLDPLKDVQLPSSQEIIATINAAAKAGEAQPKEVPAPAVVDPLPVPRPVRGPGPAIDAGQEHGPGGALAFGGIMVMEGLANYANKQSQLEAQKDAARQLPNIQAWQKNHPEQGCLLVLEFSETNPDSPALNIATQGMIARPYLGSQIVLGSSRKDAEGHYRSSATQPGSNVLRPQFIWYPPPRPAAAPEFAALGKDGVIKLRNDQAEGLANRRAKYQAEMDGWRYGFWAGVYPPFTLSTGLLDGAKGLWLGADGLIKAEQYEPAYQLLKSCLQLMLKSDAQLEAWQHGQVYRDL
jgi:hypothetical protein